MKFDPEVKREIFLMAIGCAVCTAVVAVLFALFGYFDMTVFWGAIVGYLLAFGNFFLMSVGVIYALATGDEASAKLKMRSSYIGRTIVMLAVMAVSIVVDKIHWLPVVLSIFYPRIVISVKNIVSMFFAKKKGTVENANGSELKVDSDITDEPEETDEFEKFVGGFAKGPIIGTSGTKSCKEKENNDNNQ